MMAVDQAAFLRIALRGGRFLTTEYHIETMARDLGMQADTVRQWLALVRRSEKKGQEWSTRQESVFG
ncbi:MAG: hypothetical protein H7833_18375 [Magnetococcus sp. DMHC-1]|nr:hypothetical protein [Magnetococcales bacterium]